MDDADRMRSLNVGATRARDHLVVSLHRDSKAKTNTAAKLLTDAGGRTNAVPLEDLPEPPATAAGETRTEAAPPPPREEWAARRDRARARADRDAAMVASGREGTEPAGVRPGAAPGPQQAAPG